MKTFVATCQSEANRKANEWLGQQRRLLVHLRTTVAISDTGLSLSEANRWAITVHYQAEV